MPPPATRINLAKTRYQQGQDQLYNERAEVFCAKLAADSMSPVPVLCYGQRRPATPALNPYGSWEQSNDAPFVTMAQFQEKQLECDALRTRIHELWTDAQMPRKTCSDLRRSWTDTKMLRRQLHMLHVRNITEAAMMRLTRAECEGGTVCMSSFV